MSSFASTWRRLQASLYDFNPLWIATLGAVLLAAAALHSMRSHVQESARLQDRLTGAALTDALRLYAEATAPGQAPLPADLSELADDNRGGHHRNWLDAASAEALADNSHWQVIRDADGRVRGARIKDNAAASRWLPAWLRSGGRAAVDQSYTVTVENVPPPPPPPTPVAALPQPVMPDTPLPQPAQAKAEPAPAPVPVAVAAAPAAANVTTAKVLDPKASPSGNKPAAAAAVGPSRILAGLQERQVLRLSGSGDEEPVLTPRRAAPPPAKPPAAVGAVVAKRRYTPPRHPKVIAPAGPLAKPPVRSQSAASPAAVAAAGTVTVAAPVTPASVPVAAVPAPTPSAGSGADGAQTAPPRAAA
ncbi:MAG: hypothetical protein KGI67_13530, partial [Pseudomonadota bacterium]|nr:hypothetical protein [Pseudomonadota bacterium]